MKIEFEHKKLTEQDLRELYDTLKDLDIEEGLAFNINLVICDDIASIGKGTHADITMANLLAIADIVLMDTPSKSDEEIAEKVKDLMERLFDLIDFLKNRKEAEK